MPTYDYKCTKCGSVQEERHAMAESPRIKCIKCKGKCKKDIAANYNVNIGQFRHISESDEDFA
jgi:putative FmdB family regulatory protein